MPESDRVGTARGPLGWWRAFLALPNTHPGKTLGVAALVALSCSLVVSITAVLLEPRQQVNRLGDRAAILLRVLEQLGAGPPEARLVDLAGGAYASRDSGTRTALPKDRDVAGLGAREDVATVYELRDAGVLKLVVLPVRGSGYQSTLGGYLVLESDLRTIAALRFHEQAETPGMGTRIEEESWSALWAGKQVADAGGALRIEVVKGKGTGPHQVDGISGATRTCTGVTNLLRFWLGPDGYGPYLARLAQEARK